MTSEEDSSTSGSELDVSGVPAAEKRSKVSKGGNAMFGYTCRKGRKPGSRLPNQDSWCMHRVSRTVSAYGVFDGHGEKGHLISEYCKHSLTRSVGTASKEPEDAMIPRVEAAFQRMHRAVVQKPTLGSRQSGTTATIVVHDMQNERLTVSHVGDSTAVLLKHKADTEQGLVGVPLTRDHKPNLEDERARIVKHGGRVVSDGYCYRVSKRSSSGPGLAMSRSLGDSLAHDVCGVSASPEVRVVPLRPEDKALLICSDGIWEVISPQEAAELVEEFQPWQCMEAARKLADEAIKRWLNATNGTLTDDITVLLAWISNELPMLTRTTTEASTSADTASTASPANLDFRSRSDVTMDSNIARMISDASACSP